MKRFKQLKKKSAQQLVEFLLVAPFMIIILGILIEYAYALNVNMTINQGLKEVTSQLYAQIKPNASIGDPQASVLAGLDTYLDDNNISTEPDNNLQVKSLTLGDTAVFTASYKYIPAFTLPTVYFKFIPDELNFFATSAVPSAFLNPNDYSATGVKTLALNSICGAQKGVYNNPTQQAKMLFLIPGSQPLVKPYQIKNWNNADIYVLDTSDGALYTSCNATSCTPLGSTFKNIYSGGYSIVFVHDSSGDTWDEVRGRAIALANKDAAKTSLGNYDMSPVGSYKVAASGGNVFLYNTSKGDLITNLK